MITTALFCFFAKLHQRSVGFDFPFSVHSGPFALYLVLSEGSPWMAWIAWMDGWDRWEETYTLQYRMGWDGSMAGGGQRLLRTHSLRFDADHNTPVSFVLVHVMFGSSALAYYLSYFFHRTSSLLLRFSSAAPPQGWHTRGILTDACRGVWGALRQMVSSRLVSVVRQNLCC